MAGSNARRGPWTILRCLFPAILLGTILLLPSPSWSHGSKASTTSFTGTVKAVDGGIEVALTNTGPNPTNWWHYVLLLPHKFVKVVSGVGSCGPGRNATTVFCGTASPGMQVGATFVVMIGTDGTYPVNGGVQLFTSDTFTGPLSPAGNATGPEPTTAPPPAQPCKCLSLAARILPASIAVTPGGNITSLNVEFTLHWALRCSAGTGGGCRGTVKPTGHTYTVEAASHLNYTVIQCHGSCAKTTGGGQRYRYNIGLDREGLAKLGRASIVIRRTCQGKALPPVSLWIAFDRLGRVSLKSSKLA